MRTNKYQILVCQSVLDPPVDQRHLGAGPPPPLGGLSHQEEDQDQAEQEEDGGDDHHPGYDGHLPDQGLGRPPLLYPVKTFIFLSGRCS